MLYHTQLLSGRYVRMKADKDIFIIMQLIQVTLGPVSTANLIHWEASSVSNDGDWSVSESHTFPRDGPERHLPRAMSTTIGVSKSLCLSSGAGQEQDPLSAFVLRLHELPDNLHRRAKAG